jgi:phthiocerol/phenolphthiocerol synthesis type-I polyketide synthase E
MTEIPEGAIAIIGMEGRFPGAADLEQFWHNLRDGIDSITRFSDDELRVAGVSAELLARPDYVRARGVLDGVDQFDAEFFGVSPREAALMDPQHRILLELCWQALERGGYAGGGYDGRIGVFAGCDFNNYLGTYLVNAPRDAAAEVLADALFLADKDYLATRVAYRLDLRGPAMAINTACSTGLVVVAAACQALQVHQCDMALAGGVRVGVPVVQGYVPSELVGALSSDGTCRAFDRAGDGTVPSSGAGVVLLKRLADAIADRDPIRAVIRGTAVNNDGATKVGFMAPSVEGHADVVTEALAVADVAADTISYVEAHGTGTLAGDPIEIAALTRAFRTQTAARGFCALGSVKSNIGHTSSAAGLAGLIKTVLALEHQAIPPSLHFTAPNPQIDLAGSPFRVNDALRPWPVQPGAPRRAGVSALGVGGTNAHIVLEEAPAVDPPPPSARPAHLLLLSARTPAALAQVTADLAAFAAASTARADDVAYTLAVGRPHFSHRRALACRDLRDAAIALGDERSPRLYSAQTGSAAPGVVFMFPGASELPLPALRELYAELDAFRAAVDACAERLGDEPGFDLRRVFDPSRADATAAAAHLAPFPVQLMVLFVVEYALAQTLVAMGIQPEVFVGYSSGEIVAACLAGVLSLEDAVRLALRRVRLSAPVTQGVMTSVRLPADPLAALLGPELSIAAHNAPGSTLVSGPLAAMEQLEAALSARGTEFVRSPVASAGHSSLVEPILPEYARMLGALRLSRPSRPMVSTVTGTWLPTDRALTIEHWLRHFRQPVRFTEALATVLADGDRVLVEVGPGTSLVRLVRRQLPPGGRHVAVAALPGRAGSSAVQELLTAVGALWAHGAPYKPARAHEREERRRIALPTYPFERKRFWLEAGGAGAARTRDARESGTASRGPADWLWAPSWHRSPGPAAPPRDAAAPAPCVVFADGVGLGAALAARLGALGHPVATVVAGDEFAEDGDGRYRIDPRRPDDYLALFAQLARTGQTPAIAYCVAGVAPPADGTLAAFEAAQDRGLLALVALGKALLASGREAPLELVVVSSNVYDVLGTERLAPENATSLAMALVLPHELPFVRCRTVDVTWPPVDASIDRLADQLAAEHARRAEAGEVCALRGAFRWTRAFEQVRPVGPARLRDRGVYVLVGGLGRVGLILAEHLARRFQARLVLAGRTPLPPRAAWSGWLTSHGAADPTSAVLRALEALEQAGAEVMTAQVDAADGDALARLLDAAERRFGAVHGVLYLAGQLRGEAPEALAELDPGAFARQFRPKVAGVMALSAALAGRTLEFCALASSLAAVVGLVGGVAYTAANQFVDAFAHLAARTSATPWISVDWCGWRVESPEDAERSPRAERAAPGGLRELEPAAGAEALDHLLRIPGLAQVVVSPDGVPAVGEAAVTGPTAAVSAAHTRPQLPVPYVTPEGPLEQRLAALISAQIGVAPVGRHDSLFDLGSDSINAVRLIGRCKAAFGVALALRDVVRAPTVAGIAALMERTRSDGATPAVRSLLLRVSPEAGGGAPAVAVVCVPFAGGTATSYRRLARALGPGYAVHCVDLGAAGELDDAMVARCADEVTGLGAARVIVYGHCGGTPLAFELAGALERRERSVERLYIGAAAVPIDQPEVGAQLAATLRAMSDAELFSQLQSAGMASTVAEGDVASSLAAMRSDVDQLSRYVARMAARAEHPRLRCPISCLYGEADRLTADWRALAAGWRVLGGELETVVLPGVGHYFVTEAAERVARLIDERASRAGRAGRAGPA